MINLISINSRIAPDYYLEPHFFSDFNALIRTITSGRLFLISTKFRSDLFYWSEKEKDTEVLKLWTFYTNNEGLPDLKKISFVHGDEASLIYYFQAINRLSGHWYNYKLYRDAFFESFKRDLDNPVGAIIAQCDKYLIDNKKIIREPLLSWTEKGTYEISEEAFSMAMEIIRKSPN